MGPRKIIILLILYNVAVNCQSPPHFKNLDNNMIGNNSFIFYTNIGEAGSALKCVTDSVNCCTGTNNVGNWSDVRGELVHEGSDDGTTCLYVTRGEGEISLNRRNSDCIPPTSGLWRCGIPDSSGEIQSLYIYISFNESYSEFS